ncbi:MAG: UbiX family flavin prenyltransferase [Gammaproteobacteria bacterium]|uniref:Flavin prenyltransferase UbiX n=1 Tax=Candidatus Thiopontia autotrophica TaxID=2841688 RepID=A0A8J6P864_9GAMM|nr:UbiX family flavin prenyltransferase [Candidatus Thiopontia autotrophica]
MTEWNRDSTVTLAVTGASGAAYALRLLEQLIAADVRVWMMLSDAARIVMEMEVDLSLPEASHDVQKLFVEKFGAREGQLSLFEKGEWTSPVASGSSAPYAMVVCPCSMGTLSAIAYGSSDQLLERAADVMIKENKKLILVPRETPYSAIHLENMLKLSRIGVTILPPNPGFYHQPKSIDDLVDFVVARILDQLGLERDFVQRWGSTT